MLVGGNTYWLKTSGKLQDKQEKNTRDVRIVATAVAAILFVALVLFFLAEYRPLASRLESNLEMLATLHTKIGQSSWGFYLCVVLLVVIGGLLYLSYDWRATSLNS
ncbi:hypothetical protein EJ04DRAFT_511668 [Polyplosphaeria fusca]|uniref:Uncharacterized protein n=1 Tax=Polyplosphaeria fusca TaxID=682080 RepID=A0A9P4R2I2_9PLEO|nr:hypothetical protein EJ04DRAFT_511668 [Polyplosphaeria fusca]